MSNEFNSSPIPVKLQRIARMFRWTGRISFWGQLVLAVVASLILLFAASTLNASSDPNNPGTGGGLLFAVLGLLILYFNIYRAFFYLGRAKRLGSSNPEERPKKADTIQMVQIALIGNLAGMLLTLLGAETITGSLLGKALRSQQGVAFNPSQLNQFIQPVDLFIVLGNTHTIFAHFLGIVGALWLIYCLTRPS